MRSVVASERDRRPSECQEAASEREPPGFKREPPGFKPGLNASWLWHWLFGKRGPCPAQEAQCAVVAVSNSSLLPSPPVKTKHPQLLPGQLSTRRGFYFYNLKARIMLLYHFQPPSFSFILALYLQAPTACLKCISSLPYLKLSSWFSPHPYIFLLLFLSLCNSNSQPKNPEAQLWLLSYPTSNLSKILSDLLSKWVQSLPLLQPRLCHLTSHPDDSSSFLSPCPFSVKSRKWSG